MCLGRYETNAPVKAQLTNASVCCPVVFLQNGLPIRDKVGAVAFEVVESVVSLSTSSETELQARNDESDDGHGLERQVSGFEVHFRVLGANAHHDKGGRGLQGCAVWKLVD